MTQGWIGEIEWLSCTITMGGSMTELRLGTLRARFYLCQWCRGRKTDPVRQTLSPILRRSIAESATESEQEGLCQ